MSTLKADTLLHSSGNPTTPLAIPSLDARFATAWVNFNGTGAVAIRDAYNVSSITDGGVGVYTVNFTTPLATADYAPVVGIGPAGGASPNPPLIGTASNMSTDVPPTTAGFAIVTSTSPTTVADYARITAVVFGGQV